MKKVGIVGRSGVGKSYISAFFAQKGALVIDGDKVAHYVMETPQLSAELSQAFGAEILENGRINRRRLADIVFSDPKKLRQLNKLTHKHICREFDRLIAGSSAPFAVIDAAALIESGYKCDFLIAVICGDDICTSRISKRDGISCDAAAHRLSAQQPDSFYTSHADFVIENTGDSLQSLLEEIYEKII